MATVLEDGSVFLGQQVVRPGDKQMPQSQPYFHDGERFWRLTNEYDRRPGEHRWKIHEVDPQTGKQVRESVPAWFEETEGGTVEFGASELMPAPAGAEDSPLGAKDGMLGWKTVKRRDGSYFGQGIDGRRWDKPLLNRTVRRSARRPAPSAGHEGVSAGDDPPAVARAATGSGTRAARRSSPTCRTSAATTPTARSLCCRCTSGTC